MKAAAAGNSQPEAAVRASGSSFYAAMRLLPLPQRNAMFEIYAFCRAVDDIADSQGPRPARFAELERWRADIKALYCGTMSARVHQLADPVHRFGLCQEDFLAVIDGMEMDVEHDIRAPDLATLDLYCDRVASAVGRLSVRIFGMEPEPGIALAHHLGRALQLTNILRDLDEDGSAGRLYLPREALHAAGIADSDPGTVLANPALGQACAAVAERARLHFDAADAVMACCPHASVRAPLLMAEIYHAILDGLVARGWARPRRRIRVSRLRLLWILSRHGLF